MDLEQLAPYLQETLANDLVYSDDEMIDILQEAMVELKKAKLDPPAPATKEEFPKIIPGTVFTRGSSMTASKRTKSKDADSKNTIEVPIGRPASPPLNKENPERRTQSRAGEQNDRVISQEGRSPRQQRDGGKHNRSHENVAQRGQQQLQNDHAHSQGKSLSPEPFQVQDTKRHSDYDNTTGVNVKAHYIEVQAHGDTRRQQADTIRQQERSHNLPGDSNSRDKSKKGKSRGTKFYVDESSNQMPTENNSEIPPQELRNRRRDPKLELAYRRAQNNSSVWIRKSQVNDSSEMFPSNPSEETANYHDTQGVDYHRGNPPPYRSRQSPTLQTDLSNHMAENRGISAHAGVDAYRDPRKKQPPPYPGEPLSPNQMEKSNNYQVSGSPIRREKQRTLPKGVPITTEVRYDVIEL